MKDRRSISKWISALCGLICAVSMMAGLFSAVPAAAAQTQEDSGSDRIMVSMGDSFSSGEGITPFYGQQDENGKERTLEERIHDQDWLAHRSTFSWPGQLSLPGVSGQMKDHKNTNWYFVAASGAVIQEIMNDAYKVKPYKKLNNVDNRLLETIERKLVNLGYKIGYESFDPNMFLSGDAYLRTQKWILKTLESQGKHVDYVTITIGGNDLGFSEIVTQVFTENNVYEPGGLAEMLDECLSQISKEQEGPVYKGLYNAYKMIAEYVDPDTAIIAAGYPRLFAEDIAIVNKDNLLGVPLLDLNSLFASDSIKDFNDYDILQEEARLVNDAVMEFNRVIEGIVNTLQEEGINIHFVDVADGPDSFEGHEAYSREPYLNPIWILTQSEDLDDTSMASSYSIHPNKNGAMVYARRVQEKIDQLEQARESVEQAIFEAIGLIADLAGGDSDAEDANDPEADPDAEDANDPETGSDAVDANDPETDLQQLLTSRYWILERKAGPSVMEFSADGTVTEYMYYPESGAVYEESFVLDPGSIAAGVYATGLYELNGETLAISQFGETRELLFHGPGDPEPEEPGYDVAAQVRFLYGGDTYFYETGFAYPAAAGGVTIAPPLWLGALAEKEH